MEFFEKFSFLFRLNNKINYIKELASKDNSEQFKTELLKNKDTFKKVYFYFIIFLFLPLSLSFLLKVNMKILAFVIFFLLSSFYLIFIKCLEQYEKTYYLFISFCQSIIKYENIQKKIFRVLYYNPYNKDEYQKIIFNLNKQLLEILNEKNYFIQNEQLYNEEIYFKIKGKIFINLFNDYEKLYCLNNNYIFILLKNTINSKLNKYINILNISSIELFNLNEDWNTIIQSYEENIKNIRVKEKETLFLRKSEIIYNIIISNCQINNQLKNLLNIIKNEDTEKIEEILDDIIFKKQNSLSQLISLRNEYTKKKDDKLEEITNNQLEIEKMEKENKKENPVPLMELELRKTNKINKSNKKNNYISNVNPLDIIKGEKEVQGLKMELISELEEYYLKINKNKKKEEK